MSTQERAAYAAARRGVHVVATGVAESVAAHAEQLLPKDLDAALAEVVEAEQRKLREERN